MIVEAMTRTERTMWHAPAGLPPDHRLVLVALAVCADAEDNGRQVNASDEKLTQITGLPPARIRAIVAQLADAYGIDVRPADDGLPPLPWGYYRLPTFPPPDGCRCGDCTDPGPVLPMLQK